MFEILLFLLFLQLKNHTIKQYLFNVKNHTNKTMIKRIIKFYIEGFSNMKLGKTLWLIVIVKLIIIFVVLKLFFMPDTINKQSSEGNETEYISKQITNRIDL